MEDKFKRDPKTARLEHEILPFEMGYLPELYKQKAEAELKDNPENRLKGLRALRHMIENDKSLNGWNFEEEFLLSYLRCRKFDVPRAFTQVKGYVNLRKKHKSMFTNLNFEDIAISSRNKIVTFLPYRCQDGCAILLIKLDNWVPEEFPLENARKMVAILLFQALRDPMTQVNGMKIIFDLQCNLLRHIRYITPTNIGLICYGSLECTPGRYKGVHFINESLVTKIAAIILKRVLSQKIKNRLHFHKDASSILDYFPAACIPSEYGGDLKDYDTTDWLKNVMAPENVEKIYGGKPPEKWQ